MRTITLTDADRVIYDRELRPYLPKRIFDAHTHLLINSHYPDLSSMPLAADPLLGNVDMVYLRQWWKTLFPESEVNGLVLGFPVTGTSKQ